MKQSGIYCIRNIIDNKKYVGQSGDLERRKQEFYRCHQYSGKLFQEAIEKYGKENFEYSVLTHCDKEELNYFEQFYISRLKTNDERFGYNSTSGGNLNYTRSNIKYENNIKHNMENFQTYFSLHADEIIARSGMKKCEFAEKIGVSRQNLKKVVIDSNNIQTLNKVAQVLGVSLSTLIYGTDGNKEEIIMPNNGANEIECNKQSRINGYIEVDDDIVYKIRSKEDLMSLIFNYCQL